jgi:glycosyltransferase involved in cell wall biosynthesis
VQNSSDQTGIGRCGVGAGRDRRARLVYICDWLPPDYGAVGQYSLLFARERAAQGMDVVLGGLTSRESSLSEEAIGKGRLKVIKIHAEPYEKGNFSRRLRWTVATNTRLILELWRHLRWTDEILFTGSPPLFLHWIAPLNVVLRKKLTYRITDFHPECLMAARKTVPLWLAALYRLTVFWRRRIAKFEVLGNDQRDRLVKIGLPIQRIELKRDPSPVEINSTTQPLDRPDIHRDSLIILYSGNWGVAHDYDTFVEAYRRHHRQGSGRFVLWLNAVGAAVSNVECALATHRLPYIAGRPVPLEELASLLVTPDAHLITLSDEFVGYVLPSKVHGCVASGKPVLFVGSERSDVHELCAGGMSAAYERVEAGDVTGCADALERLAESIVSQRKASVRGRPR